ncbi:DEAD/DEAH box helicase [Candidatus Pacearchaeota archaeon]|nr:DEAD/DEAH box helicase [Candidatus Pacearchaeota archaeon]
MKTFKELGLSREFVSVLEKARITTPLEIQEKTIPLVLAGRDVIGGSATGSGKTLAFVSGIVENLEQNGRVQALILTPTRELAEQIADSVKKFSKHRDLNVLAVYGGVNIQNQIRRLQDTDVVVGTPGRILDHLSRRTLNLRGVRFLVLDEVDRMFDMGFQIDVKKILRECPKQRQTMLFSATISSVIDNLAKMYTKKAVEVSVKSHVDATKLKQVYYDVPDGLKFSLFVHLLKKEKGDLIMVFCGTRRNVDFVVNNLIHLGIKAKAIHGGMVQNKRNKVLHEFDSKGGVNILVCTDVAARGLDIQGVSHVYNYDLPKTSEEYIHRIGRTARVGKQGIAISILCSRDYDNFNNIQRDEKLKITAVPLPLIERVRIIVDRKNFRRGGNQRGFRNAPRRSQRPRESFMGRDSRMGRTDGKSYGGRDSGRTFNKKRKPSFNRGRANNKKPVSRGRKNSFRRGENRRRRN